MPNPKCQRCLTYFTPTLKTSGEPYKNCDRCREVKQNKTKKNNSCIKCNIKRPCYGLPTDTKATLCGDCKSNDMINIKDKKCINCNIKIPCYGLPIDTKATLCGDCKSYNMVNIKDKKCIKCNKKIPYFGLPSDKKATLCGDCKTDNMIDIISKKCIKCNIKIPTFGLPTDTKATLCSDCKSDNMINIKHSKCIKCNIKIPSYGLPTDTKATLCGDCKTDNMINIVSPKCITLLCDKFSQIDNYCIRCFYALNPNDKRCTRIKFKENEMVKYINETFKNLNWICDNPLIGDGICLRYKPDMLLNLNNHSIVIECDEHQHKYSNYNNTCEEAREHQIQEALDRPVVFIRFNPDAYLDNNKKKVMSCFNVDKKLGFNTIPKNQEERWKLRLNTLRDTILKSVEKPPINPIEKVYLYYDGF